MAEINTDTFVKLQFHDYTIIEKIFEDCGDLDDHETMVLAKVRKIIRLMKEKYEKVRQENARNSTMDRTEVDSSSQKEN